MTDALVRIVRDDGAAGLFRGAGPTVVRAMALNMGMLASNDQAKEAIAAAGYAGQPAGLGGAMIAGMFVTRPSRDILVLSNILVPPHPQIPAQFGFCRSHR